MLLSYFIPHLPHSEPRANMSHKRTPKLKERLSKKLWVRGPLLHPNGNRWKILEMCNSPLQHTIPRSEQLGSLRSFRKPFSSPRPAQCLSQACLGPRAQWNPWCPGSPSSRSPKCPQGSLSSWSESASRHIPLYKCVRVSVCVQRILTLMKRICFKGILYCFKRIL